MLDYTSTYDFLQQGSLSSIVPFLKKKVIATFKNKSWGDFPRWERLIKDLPQVDCTEVVYDLMQSIIRIGEEGDISLSDKNLMIEILKGLCPWRKGPFNIFGIYIDTEWRSNLKWDRLKGSIRSLNGRTVLDVGCGSGYYCWRMKGEGAKLVVGIDPTILYPMQFQVFQKYIQDDSVCVFPLGIDDMPKNVNIFDTVFSMGILYHRQSPFDHLLQLKGLMNSGGELVLESLVIEGKSGDVLSPKGRYAKMPNVWFIPSCLTLEAWLRRVGFKDVRLVDVSTTCFEEQRSTEWIESQSLSYFLDPDDITKTCEGYPAPKRAIFIAHK